MTTKHRTLISHDTQCNICGRYGHIDELHKFEFPDNEGSNVDLYPGTMGEEDSAPCCFN